MTTLTPDPDVAQKLGRSDGTAETHSKDAVNRKARAGLSIKKRTPKTKFKVTAHSFGFAPGIDLNKMNQLVDDLEAEDVLARCVETQSADSLNRSASFDLGLFLFFPPAAQGEGW